MEPVRLADRAFFGRFARLLRYSVLFACVSGAGLSGALYSAQSASTDYPPVKVALLERPPFYHLVNGEPQGFLLLRAKRIFEAAGIPVASYEALPARRILAVIEQNASPVCSVGWFRNAERERYARYSDMIHQDRPQVVLTRRSMLVQVGSAHTLLELFDDPDLRLGLIDGYSYGAYLDAAIKARHALTDTNSRSAANLVERLALGRVDFVLIDPEEADYIFEQGVAGRDIVPVKLPGVPVGNKRYLICSAKVPAEVMTALNAAINRLAPGPRTGR